MRAELAGRLGRLGADPDLVRKDRGEARGKGRARRAISREAVRESTTRENIRQMIGLTRLDRGLSTSAEAELAHAARPRTRADCEDMERPCPWLGCRHHLGLDAQTLGGEVTSIAVRDPSIVSHTCSLDVAESGIPRSLDDIAEILGISRERARQIESEALYAFGQGMAGAAGLRREGFAAPDTTDKRGWY